MTVAELNQLQPDTLIYLPNEWEVITWTFQGQVGTSNYYTLTYPPDADGVVSNRRPVYLHGVDLKFATLDPVSAWENVRSGLHERSVLVQNMIMSLTPIQKKP